MLSFIQPNQDIYNTQEMKELMRKAGFNIWSDKEHSWENIEEEVEIEKEYLNYLFHNCHHVNRA